MCIRDSTLLKPEATWPQIQTLCDEAIANHTASVCINTCSVKQAVESVSYTHLSEVVSVGDTIEVYVKDIDTENHKVSLGYKKAEGNPCLLYTSVYCIEMIVS